MGVNVKMKGKIHLEDLEGELRERFFPPRYDLEESGCPFITECRQELSEICLSFEKCLVYQRMKILDRKKSKTGLERFKERYPDYEKMFVGSRK